MPEHSEKHEDIKLYLLGDLSEEIRQTIEERLMTESGFLDELEVCEDELVDKYVNNELDAEDRAKFESHFLCGPDRMRKLKFAMALSRCVSQAADAIEPIPDENQSSDKRVDPTWVERFGAFWNAQSWAFRFVSTVAVIAIIAVAIWLPRTPRSTVALTLSISASERAEGTASTRVSLPLDADALRITLRLPEPPTTASGFRVELMSDMGGPKQLEIEGWDAQSVTVVILRNQLGRGEYALRLFSIKSDGTEQRINGNYFFTVQ